MRRSGKMREPALPAADRTVDLTGRLVRSIALCGTAYAIGFQHGRAIAGTLRSFLSDGFAHINKFRSVPLSRIEIADAVRQHARIIEEDQPDIAEELRGLAAGAGVSYEQAVLLQIRRELIREGPSGCSECTMLAAMQPETGAILGQTIDLYPGMTDLGYVLTVEPDGAPSYVTYTFAGLLGYVGLNAAGLAICINFVQSNDWQPGLSPYLLVRHLLRFDGIDPCIAELKRIRRSSSRCLTVADRRRIVAIEMTARELRVIEGEKLFHTNHYVHEDLVPCDRMNVFSRNASKLRLARVQEIADERTHPWDPDAIFDVLSDHSLAPIGLCAHGTGDPRREETVASVVMQPRAGGLHARKGRTCERVTRSFVLRREDLGRAPSTGNRHRCENRGESA
jgi:isopenicillin-N N-acyltransferase-like protein